MFLFHFTLANSETDLGKGWGEDSVGKDLSLNLQHPWKSWAQWHSYVCDPYLYSHDFSRDLGSGDGRMQRHSQMS